MDGMETATFRILRENKERKEMLLYQRLEHSAGGLTRVPAISAQSCASAQTQPDLSPTGVKHFQRL